MRIASHVVSMLHLTPPWLQVRKRFVDLSEQVSHAYHNHALHHSYSRIGLTQVNHLGICLDEHRNLCRCSGKALTGRRIRGRPVKHLVVSRHGQIMRFI